MHAPLFGIGFRSAYAADFAEARPGVDWLELVSDHHLGAGGPRRALLARLRRDHPIALHGVGLGIAGCDPLDDAYLDGLRDLVDFCEPRHVSDHLCWTALGGRASHDLLPVACTEAVLRHVAQRVERVQERIDRRLLLENATRYGAFRASDMDEADFAAELCRRTGCGVLLDVNNLVVNAHNLASEPTRWLRALPEGAVGYLHVAGHTVLHDVRIDTHAEAVPASVWELFEGAARRHPDADVILERDAALPPLAELVAELDLARAHHAAAGDRRAPVPEAESPRAKLGSDAPIRSGDWPRLQRQFWECAVDPDGVGPGDAAAFFADDRPVRAARGARVYAEAHRATLRAALAENFPALTRVLAPEDWRRLVRDYLRAHPPRGHGFVSLGASLPDFARRFAFAADYGVSRDAIADLAALEQAELEAQDAPDPGSLVAPEDLAAIAAVDWPALYVVFVPGLRLLRTDYDVASVVSAVACGGQPTRPERAPCAFRVGRGVGGELSEPLACEDARLLEALLAGRPFRAACAEDYPDADAGTAAVRGARWLVSACARGLVAAIRRDSEHRVPTGAASIA